MDNVNVELYERLNCAVNTNAGKMIIRHNKNITLLEFISANMKIYAVAID